MLVCDIYHILTVVALWGICVLEQNTGNDRRVTIGKLLPLVLWSQYRPPSTWIPKNGSSTKQSYFKVYFQNVVKMNCSHTARLWSTTTLPINAQSTHTRSAKCPVPMCTNQHLSLLVTTEMSRPSPHWSPSFILWGPIESVGFLENLLITCNPECTYSMKSFIPTCCCYVHILTGCQWALPCLLEGPLACVVFYWACAVHLLQTATIKGNGLGCILHASNMEWS